MPVIGGGHWWLILLVLVVVLIIWGPGKLPDVGAGMGRAIREFRKASTETKEAINPMAAPVQQAPAPQPAQPGGDERPHLPQDHRQRQDQPDSGGHLHGHGESLGGAGEYRRRDDAVRVVQDQLQRVQQQPDDEVVEHERDDGADHPGQPGDDQHAAELLEVLHESHAPLFVQHTLH